MIKTTKLDYKNNNNYCYYYYFNPEFNSSISYQVETRLGNFQRYCKFLLLLCYEISIIIQKVVVFLSVFQKTL